MPGNAKRPKVGPKSKKAGYVHSSDSEREVSPSKKQRMNDRIQRIKNENDELVKMIKETKADIRRVKEEIEEKDTSQDAKREKLVSEIELKKKEVSKLKKDVDAREKKLRDRSEEITESTDRECQRLVDAYTGSEQIVALVNLLNKEYDKLEKRIQHTSCEWKHSGTQVDFDKDLKNLKQTAAQVTHINRQISNVETLIKQVLKLEEKIGINQGVLTRHLNNTDRKVKKEEIKTEVKSEIKSEKMEFDLPNSWAVIKVKTEKMDEPLDDEEYFDAADSDGSATNEEEDESD